MFSQTTVLLAIFGVIVVAVVLTLIKREHNPVSKITLDDLLLGDDGKISKAAAVMMGSFVATTWVLVYQTAKGTVTDITFAAYLAAWVAPTVTRLIVNGAAPPSPPAPPKGS